MKNTNLETFAQNAKKLLETQIESRIAQIESGEITISVMDNLNAVNKLMARIKEIGRKSVIEEVAYTWFNRICAIRYMDARGYNSTLIVTPLPGMILPEILSDALSGVFDDDVVSVSQQERIRGLLNGSIASDNAQRDIYRILLVASCNAFHKSLPVLFEEIKDYTDLLLPEDLLSSDSIIFKTVEAMTEEDCQSVEIIGWLYQYYISEKKDQVMKKKKRSADDIPAATQLFTPDWIVRYLVENSIGRLWMQNHPNSKLKNEMKYYVDDYQTNKFLYIEKPEDFKVCDPCCGSGHMLTYSFEILMLIYEECGYTVSDSVDSIIRNNLYGIEIDKRAGQLAYFALMMKAREKDRRVFKRHMVPNICVLEDFTFTKSELDRISYLVDCTSFKLSELLNQFTHSKILGSLINPCMTNLLELKQKMENLDNSLFDSELIEYVECALNQAEFLTTRYNVLITNPPYIVPSTCDAILNDFAKKYYPNSKADLGTMFIERARNMVIPDGVIAMVTLHSWMFLKFEILRHEIINGSSILTMAHVGADGFDSINGEVVQTTAFILLNRPSNIIGVFFKLEEAKGEKAKSDLLLQSIKCDTCNKYFASKELFSQIPGERIIYWANDNFIAPYKHGAKMLKDVACPCAGLTTGNNNLFQRLWHEVRLSNIGFDIKSIDETIDCKTKWYPCNTGGDFRKWFPDNSVVVNWLDNGADIRKYTNAKGVIASRAQNTSKYFKEGLTWNKLSTTRFCAKYKSWGSIFDDTSRSAFPDNEKILFNIIGFLNSKVAEYYLKSFNPTMSFTNGDLEILPYLLDSDINLESLVNSSIRISKEDCDSFETSWDFKINPLIKCVSYLGDATSLGCAIDKYYGHYMPYSSPIELCYLLYKGESNEQFFALKNNEELINKIYIEAYNLEEELNAEVLDKNISVHRVFDLKDDIPVSMQGNKYVLVLEDIIKNFISYAIGCMFGRYSLDRDGIIYAGGNWDISHYRASFSPDEDNVIPIVEDTWFDNDIESQFIKFVEEVFGEDDLEANLKFIEKALGKSLRKYFNKDFYKDHLKMYQKRPIYWMFSSPKGYFKALVYMHRYNENTANVVLSQLRDLRAKVKAQLEAARMGGNTKLENEYMIMDKDLDEYENEILYPLAVEHVTFDLDDGVKVNYQKLGKALVPIK